MGSLNGTPVGTQELFSSGGVTPRASMRDPSPRGYRFERRFTSSAVRPLDAVEWEHRDCVIANEHGVALFTQRGVEAPKSWSQMATTVVASKYLHGAPGSSERESGVRALIERVMRTITEWGRKDRYFRSEDDAAVFGDELTHVLVHQRAAFNSPVWFNVGVRPQPQCSACFIISVDDSLDSLLSLQTLESRIFKYGSGSGTNFSTIRSAKETLKGGGVPSGPISFMRAFDAWAGIIKSGGKTRRAAKMLILNADHPDIMDFITCKPEEEKKAWALMDAGYDGSFAARGGAYDSISFQNANLSVRVSDEFMRAVENNGEYALKNVRDGSERERLSARAVLRAIAEATHACGDPGMQFDTTINAWHTVPRSGRINASNPCSEYMSLDNSACNLASINLLKFLLPTGEFDVESFSHTVELLICAQDILIDNSSYPSEAIGRCAREFRQLGLGFTNLGAVLMQLGVAYDSTAGRAWAAAITSLMTAVAYRTSARCAEHMGAFRGYKKNRAAMLDVVRRHRTAAAALKGDAGLTEVLSAGLSAWDDALACGGEHGFRNSQVTVLAPTGTISFMMDCDTTGIEPELALVKYKKLADGGMMKIVNQSVATALERLGYSKDAICAIVTHIEKTGTIEGAPEMNDAHLSVFDCALKPAAGTRVISYQGHLAMMAAVQPFLSGAISKTVNLPSETSDDEIFEIYRTAWKSGLKAVALYRDGSKRTQPLNVKEKSASVPAAPAPVRRRLPNERPSITHRFTVGGFEGYLTVGLYEDKTPGEIFLVVAKEGSTLSGLMDAFATSVSLALQYGVPLAALVKKFSHMRFEPAGFTGNKDIPVARSIIDYVFRWLGFRFLSAEDRAAIGLLNHDEGSANAAPPSAGSEIASTVMAPDAPPCSNCGSSMMVRQGSCYVCLNCGSQGGCG